MNAIKRYDLKLEETGEIQTRVQHIGQPLDVLEIMKDFQFVEKSEEEIVIMTLSTANEVVGIFTVAKGGVSSCLLYTSAVFRRVLLSGCERFIMVHNHPFGSMMPSKEDEFITHKVSRACRDLDLNMLDHVIVSRNGYYSFKENNNLHE